MSPASEGKFPAEEAGMSLLGVEDSRRSENLPSKRGRKRGVLNYKGLSLEIRPCNMRHNGLEGLNFHIPLSAISPIGFLRSAEE